MKTPVERLAEAIEADFEPEQIGDWQGESYAVLLQQRLEEKGFTLISRRSLDPPLAELREAKGASAAAHLMRATAVVWTPELEQLIREDERRATVERIRDRINGEAVMVPSIILRILDEVQLP